MKIHISCHNYTRIQIVIYSPDLKIGIGKKEENLAELGRY